MIELKITEDERDILVEILEAFVSDIRMEIADTDNSTFKDKLKARKLSVKKILQQMQTESPGKRKV